tara:strand:+ start:255 stop:590 length:336 start_codon:yes stop_codon:yes gene_type:complete
MLPPKSKKEKEEELKKMSDAYDQSQDLDGGMSSWTYNMGELNTGATVTTAGIGSLDDDIDIKFDVSDGLSQHSFDFEDETLRKKYPALQDAWEHFQNVKQMCETREKEEDA